MKVKTINFLLLKGISFPTFTSWEIYVWILVMFVGADQFLEIFLDLQFLPCILSRYLPMCTQNLVILYLKHYPWHFIWRDVVLKCCSGHKFLHCAMEQFQAVLKAYILLLQTCFLTHTNTFDSASNCPKMLHHYAITGSSH